MTDSDLFAEYLEALDKCRDACRLTAFHTAEYSLLTVYYVKEVLSEK